MMSLPKNVNLKKVCLTAGCLLAVSLVSLPESSAGIIPWTYNAIFGPSRNGPMYYGAGYAPAPYTASYGGYGMGGGCNSCGTPGYTSYYGGPSRAASRRSSRAAYRWYLINNPQAVGVSYRNFNGGNMYASNYAGYAPAGYGYGSPCGMGGCATGACGLGGCSTGACGAGGCNTGACGVSYPPASASTPTPEPNNNTSGKKVPEPREIESTPPKTYAEEPMNSGNPMNSRDNVEDSGFGERRYDRKTPMDTPAPGNETEDLFKEPLKRDASESPMPGSSTPAPDFGNEPAQPNFGTEPAQPGFGPKKKSDEDLFGTGDNKAFKPTPDGKLPETKSTIPQKKAAPTTQPEKKAPKAEQETNHLPPLRVRPLNLDQKITWKSAPRAERLTIRAHFTAPQIAKQNVPSNSGWYAIDDSARIASN